jgi:hypothetical protein
VIMGRLIPAGTGLSRYRNVKLAFSDQSVAQVEETEGDEVQDVS